MPDASVEHCEVGVVSLRRSVGAHEALDRRVSAAVPWVRPVPILARRRIGCALNLIAACHLQRCESRVGQATREGVDDACAWRNGGRDGSGGDWV